MTSPIWQTPKDLGIIADGTPFEKQLVATNPPISNLLYQVIAGTLPNGLTLSDSGRLYGTPSVITSLNKEINYKTSFTIRAINPDGRIADRTFSLMVSGVAPAIIENTNSFLGAFYDGDYFRTELKAINTNNFTSNLTWKFVRGRLPPGITFNTNGVLEGFFYQNRVPDQAFANMGWDKNSWDDFIYDFIKQEHDSSYEFTVELSDGINQSRQTYVMKVIAKDYLSVDSTAITNDTKLISIDRTPRHMPFISTMPQVLSEIRPSTSRQNTYFSFKFDALGFDQNDPMWNYNIVYEITSLDYKGWDQFGDLENHVDGVGFDTDEFDGSDFPLPPGIGLNEETGWYIGRVLEQEEYQKKYEFYVFARPDFVTDLSNYIGHKSKFGLNILGPAEETITWTTDESLGTIVNGKAIEIQINAVHSTNKPLIYGVASDGSRTPQGIVVLKNGVVSGRASVEYFKLDNDVAIIDGGKTTFDRKYTFTVRAYTENKSAYSEKVFTLSVDYLNKKPYDNLYLKGFPTANQRRIFDSIMNNQDLFPDELIYRLNDPDYGKAKDLRFLFLPGINTVALSDYVEVLKQNHYTKILEFGDIKTAIALDENYNIQYEVVYLDIIDDSEEKDPVTGEVKVSNRLVNLSQINKNFYISNGVEYKILTPNSLNNMRNRIETQIGYANRNSLPLWMTGPQPDPANPGLYTTPLGYVPAAVLAYTKPGASNLIAYRLRDSKFSFNRIEFKTDRYQVDSYLSKHYDLKTKKIIPGELTNFDINPSVAEKLRVMGMVDFAVTVDYLEVAGQSIANFRINAGVKDQDTVKTGDTVIFSKRGTFPPEIPGWLDQILVAGLENYQAAIFTIVIEDNSVTLTMSHICRPGDIINVTRSEGYENKQLFLQAYPKQDIVPHWWTLTDPLIDDIFKRTSDKLLKPHNETTFDKGGTRFVSNRTYYSNLDPVAKYIKFPKTGVFT